MSRLYTDNARALFAAGIGASDLTFTCTAGKGALFPNPTSPDYFLATFESQDKTKVEVVKVTARSTDSFTIPAGGRAQDGTTAQTWTTNDSITLRWTASSSTLLLRADQFNTHNYSLDTGVSATSSYQVTLDPSPLSYAAGLRVVFKASFQCGNNPTLNVNSIGAVSLRKFVTEELSPGDIIANQIVEAIHDGTFWQIVSYMSSERSGTIRFYAGTNLHPGWLKCDGSAVSRTTYAKLFAVIGTIYGVGDNSTTFNLPDVKGRVLVGDGTGTGLTARAIGSKGGEENHILTVSELAPHSHSYVIVGDGVNFLGSSSPYAGLPAGTTGANTGTTGSGSGHNTMQPFLVTQCIIKT